MIYFVTILIFNKELDNMPRRRRNWKKRHKKWLV